MALLSDNVEPIKLPPPVMVKPESPLTDSCPLLCRVSWLVNCPVIMLIGTLTEMVEPVELNWTTPALPEFKVEMLNLPEPPPLIVGALLKVTFAALESVAVNLTLAAELMAPEPTTVIVGALSAKSPVVVVTEAVSFKLKVVGEPLTDATLTEDPELSVQVGEVIVRDDVAPEPNNWLFEPMITAPLLAVSVAGPV